MNDKPLKKRIRAGGWIVSLTLALLLAVFLPLRSAKNSAEAALAAAKASNARSRAEVEKANGPLEKERLGLLAALGEMSKGRGKGSPVAWFPTAVDSFFKSRGITAVSVKPVVGASSAEKWTVKISSAPYARLGVALGEMENGMPTAEIREVVLLPSGNTGETVDATLELGLMPADVAGR